MVKKLLGYEIKYYAKYLTPAFIIVAALSLVLKVAAVVAEAIIDGFGLHWGFSMAGTVISLLSIYLLAFVFAAVSFYLAILAVVRYYKNLYSSEGYLTLSLPVSATAHVGVKLGGYLIALLATMAVELLSLCILFSGELPVEIVKAALYMLKQGEWSILVLPALALVSIPLAAVGSVFGVLVYYTCISIGQRFNKNRILIAIGAFVGYYILTYILSMGVALLVMAITLVSGLGIVALEMMIDGLGEEIYLSIAFITPAVMYIISTVFYAIGSVFLFIFSRNTLKKKLNLE